MEPDGGKYGSQCDAIQQQVGGTVALIVIDGNKGDGFSLTGHQETLYALPRVLRIMADDIERQLRQGSN